MEVDQAVAIRELKRFAADQVGAGELPVAPIEERAERVAVIGSGPAGLTVAYYLRLKGYRVTLFEALERLGGMLRFGIPDYRLPPEVLDREIDHLLAHGIETRTGMRFGSEFTLADLAQEGFRAIYLGIGAHGSLALRIPGEEGTEGVVDAVTFLRDANSECAGPPGRRVAVVGGGNVAIDAARAALRLGSERVTVVYRRSQQEMPAYAEEVEGAREEGIRFAYLSAPVRIESANGRVTGLMCIRTELGPPDGSGRRRPVPVAGSEFVIDCDRVIPAIGQRTDDSWADREPGIRWTSRRTLAVDPVTYQTALPHVFAGGDAVTGPATVIEAVAAGHKAVDAIDRYLNGRDLQASEGETAARSRPAADWAEIPAGTPPALRARGSHLPAGQRVASFVEVEREFSEDQARQEASRCLNCGVCCECMACVGACEAAAIDHTMQEEQVTVQVGSIILATGYDILDPTPLRQYGYGVFPNVYTALEFERLSNATGPTGGRILIRDETGALAKPPGSVALLHCIGSRDVNYH